MPEHLGTYGVEAQNEVRSQRGKTDEASVVAKHRGAADSAGGLRSCARAVALGVRTKSQP